MQNPHALTVNRSRPNRVPSTEGDRVGKVLTAASRVVPGSPSQEAHMATSAQTSGPTPFPDSGNGESHLGRRLASANELRWLGEEADGKRSESTDENRTDYTVYWKRIDGGQWRLALTADRSSVPAEDIV